MTIFVIRRVAWLIVTAVLLSFVLFFATEALPGNVAIRILGQAATPQSIARLRTQLGLNASLMSQYLTWAGHLLTGNLGRSLASGRTLTSTLGTRVLNSALLVGVTSVIAMPLAVVIGMLLAARRGRVGAEVAGATMLGLISLPQFVIGILLILLLSTGLFHVLPAVTTVAPGQSVVHGPTSLVLPVLTLVLASTPYLARLVAASAAEVLRSEYVVAARFRGVRGWPLLFRHVLPNALVPTVQAMTLTVAYLAGGIVIVESVFNYPGIGQAFVSAVANRDVPTIQIIALGLALVYLVLNLIGDVVSILLTPRLRTAMS
jgi:peptide/nickel transport system permease protein